MFGVVRVCARDGFSGKIVGHAAILKKKPCNISRSIQVNDYIFHLQGVIYFKFLNYFDVLYNLVRNSLRCNVKTSQSVFDNDTSFY